MIKNRITKLEQVDWRNIHDLQPKNLKQVFNYAAIEESIQKYGFAFPFGVWQDKDGTIYAIDGHTRKEVLSSMEGVPELLPAFFIDAKNKKEAIRILLDVYNQKHNPMDGDVLADFLLVEEIAVESIAVGSLNVFGLGGGSADEAQGPDYSLKNQELDMDAMSDKMTIKLEYTQDEYNKVKEQLSRIAHTPEQAVWQLLGNE